MEIEKKIGFRRQLHIPINFKTYNSKSALDLQEGDFGTFRVTSDVN